MTDVIVKIPEERLAEFYGLVARFLSGQSREEPAVASVVVQQQWTNTAEDLALARQVWKKLSGRAKDLFALLMEQPERKVLSDELAAALEIPRGKSGVAGVLAWPARYCAAVNRVGLWDWEYGRDGEGAYYWMGETTAGLFRNVRELEIAP